LALVEKERLAPAQVLIFDGVKVPPDCRRCEVGCDQKRKKRRE
jgi:hypothetical protein